MGDELVLLAQAFDAHIKVAPGEAEIRVEMSTSSSG